MTMKIPQVAVAYPSSVPWIARCLDGIRSYAKERGGWQLYTSPPSLGSTGEWELSLRSLQDWDGDAIIAVSSNEAELKFTRELGIPTVNLGAGLAVPHGVPRVMVDHVSAGRMAAEHLMELGLTNLAFFGWTELWYSERRQHGFVERAAESGIRCDSRLEALSAEPNQTWRQRMSGPLEWLNSLPRPCGVFAVQDYRARLLIEACEHTGLRVPEDIAVIGMDNNETVCEHSVPTITSVSRNSELIGWTAATLLHEMMQGNEKAATDLLIPPGGVRARQSTDALYQSDPIVSRSIAFLLSQLNRVFDMTTLAEHAGVSKRTLETRFRRCTGYSPYEYIVKIRIKKARALIQFHRKKPLQEIASACGFGTYPTFLTTFQRHVGMNPNEFRQACERGNFDARG